MAGKNDKPAARGKGAPGKATKQSAATSTPKDKVGQVLSTDQPAQGEAPGASLQEMAQTASTLMASALAVNVTGQISSIGNQVQPGTPEAGSAAAYEPAQPGADQNCFADSSPKSIPGLAVTSSQDGFWRAGIQWTKAEKRVAIAELGEEKFNLVCDEPMLTVNYVDLADPVGDDA